MCIDINPDALWFALIMASIVTAGVVLARLGATK